MRAFVGTLLTAADAAAIAAMTAALLEAGGGRLRAVPAGALHLTYLFIGELPEDGLDATSRAIADATRDVPPASVTFGAPHILYGGRDARLVLLPATEGAEWLAALARRVAAAVADALPALALSVTPAPHVTVARFRRGTARGAARSVETVISERLAGFRCPSRIDAVQIVESRLAAGGPTYVSRHEQRLGVEPPPPGPSTPRA